MTTTKQGCGCGCGGKDGGGCGCGRAPRAPERVAAACSPCETSAFVRPRFFAGQLLTEDDLEALMTYLVSKQRFHAARWFGAGVVCGLEVTCGPCDGRQLVVQPGYALDCCGNDLVLTCARTLDLAGMINELHARTHGAADCAKPCLPSGDGKDGPPPRLRYCLYARYTERQDELIAAYPNSDDCDATSCQATRIVEGITFELACPPPPAKPPLTWDELDAACSAEVYPPGAAEAQAGAAAMQLASRIEYASRLARAHAQRARVELTDAELADLRAASQRPLTKVLAGLSPAQQLVARGRYVAMIGGPLARAQRHQLEVEVDVELDRLVHDVRSAVEAIRATPTVAGATAFDHALAAGAANAWFDVERGALEVDSPAYQLYTHGAQPLTKAIAQAATAGGKDLGERLKALASCAGRVHTDCELRKVIEALGTPVMSEDLDEAIHVLADPDEAARRFIADCKCSAAIPPCTPCTDQGVLLACFEVEGCEVVRICNHVRRYVLAPSSVAYWHDLGLDAPPRDLLEECCGAPAADSAKLAWTRRVPQLQLLAQAKRDATTAPLLARLHPALAPAAEPSADAELARLRHQLDDALDRLSALEARAATPSKGKS